VLSLHLTRDFITLASVESNPKDSPGDQLVIYTNLVGDTVTGKEAQVCTVLKADKPPRFETTMFQCLETIQLRDGQLTGQQLSAEDKTSTDEAEAAFAITGGTGAYKQAHGFGLFTDDGKTLTCTWSTSRTDGKGPDQPGPRWGLWGTKDRIAADNTGHRRPVICPAHRPSRRRRRRSPRPAQALPQKRSWSCRLIARTQFLARSTSITGSCCS